MRKSISLLNKILQPIYPPQECEAIIRQILKEVCHYNSAEIILNKNSDLLPTQQERIEKIGLELTKHRPLQYILGHTSFLNWEFEVREGVLIPRPETEELVMEIINDYKNTNALNIADICSGSGCIAISLNKSLSCNVVEGWEISAQAVEIAQANNRLLNAAVTFKEIDILHPREILPNKKFDIVVSNPPYVCISEQQQMEEHVLDFEPHIALFVEDENPLIFYDQIATLSLRLLKHKGSLYFEINPLFYIELTEMLQQKGYENICVWEDIFGRKRFIKATNTQI